MSDGALAGFAGFAVLLLVLIVFVLRFARDLHRGLRPGARRLDRAAAARLNDHADQRGDREREAEDRTPKSEDER